MTSGKQEFVIKCLGGLPRTDRFLCCKAFKPLIPTVFHAYLRDGHSMCCVSSILWHKNFFTELTPRWGALRDNLENGIRFCPRWTTWRISLMASVGSRSWGKLDAQPRVSILTGSVPIGFSYTLWDQSLVFIFVPKRSKLFLPWWQGNSVHSGRVLYPTPVW